MCVCVFLFFVCVCVHLFLCVSLSDRVRLFISFARMYFFDCVFVPRAMGLVVSRETQHMGVPYYVDKSFEKEYRGESLDELEKTIESDYIDHLQTSCWKEKQQSTSGAHARRGGTAHAPFQSPHALIGHFWCHTEHCTCKSMH